jgi:transcription initiation factor TFIIE subunit beta
VPSPALSNVSGSGLQKRKRDAFSSSNGAPAPRKTAVQIQQEGETKPATQGGQIAYAVDHLKQLYEKGQPGKTWDELTRFLSIQRANADDVAKLEAAMIGGKVSPKILYDPKTKLFSYKPTIPVRDAESLRAFLQQRKSTIGVKVDDVKDGWADCIPALESMAGKGEILLVRQGSGKQRMHNAVDFSSASAAAEASRERTAREMQPKTIWASDASLVHTIPDDLKREWHQIPLPGMESTLREKLVAAGLKPTTAPIEQVAQVAKAGPKSRKPRKNARGTATNVNVPMRDYSHLRK